MAVKIYDKLDDFDFDMVNFVFLDGDVSRRTVYIAQLIRFARASHFSDFNCRNKALTAKLLKQGYRYQNLQHGISEPEFYGDFENLWGNLIVRIV